MSSEKQFKIVSTIFFILVINSVSCSPIDVTGKNIKYYQLTPNEGSGSYKFDYGTHDGAQRSERGYIKPDVANPKNKQGLLVVAGSFKDAHGEDVFYIADEQGYRIATKDEVDELHRKMPDIPVKVGEPTRIDYDTENREENDNKKLSNTILPETPRNNVRSSKDLQPSPKDLQPSSTEDKKKLSNEVISPVDLQSRSSIPNEETPNNGSSNDQIIKSQTTTRKPTTKYQIPVTESQLIKVSIIEPIKTLVTCAPGKCSGNRQSKIFKIKSLKIGR